MTATLQAVVDELEADADPGPPIPLFRPAEQAEPFPLEELPTILRDGVAGIVGHVQCPRAMAAQSVLATAALIAQPHVDAPLFNGALRPVSLFFVTIAESGERKSSADALATKPLSDFESALAKAYQPKSARYDNALEAWEEARKHAKKANKGDYDATTDALNKLGRAPTPPPFPQLRCSEPTAEGLWLLLKDGLGTCGLFSAEGGQFLSGHAMNADHRVKTAAMLSSAWDGEPLDRVRKGDGMTVLTNRRLSTHLMIQPDIGARLLADRDLTDQGLNSRILFCAPASTQGARFQRDPTLDEIAALKRYHAVMAQRIALPIRTQDDRNTLAPVGLIFTAEAYAMLRGFADWCEEGLGLDGDFVPIKGFANKLPEHAARLATVFTFIADPDAAEIDADTMAAATTLMRWYAGERLRLVHNSHPPLELVQAEQLRLWIRDKWREDHISPVEVYQRGPRFARNQAHARKLMTILADHNWLRAVVKPMVIAGHRRKEPYQIVPAAAT